MNINFRIHILENYYFFMLKQCVCVCDMCIDVYVYVASWIFRMKD